MQRSSYAGRFLKCVKVFVQTGRCHYKQWVERKGSGQGTYVAVDLFCGSCREKMHIVCGRWTKQRENYSIVPAWNSFDKQYLSYSSWRKKRHGSRNDKWDWMYLYQMGYIYMLFLLTTYVYITHLYTHMHIWKTWENLDKIIEMRE